MVNYDDLISALNESNSVRETAEKLGISETSCFRYIKKYEIDYKQFFKNNRNKVFIPLETILQAQSVSNSAAETARLLGVPFTTYKRVAESYGVYETNQGLKSGNKYSTNMLSIINNQKYSSDSNAFKNMNAETAYWLGFFAADGYISRGNQIGLTLKAEDKEHLEKFRRFLKSDVEIKFKNALCSTNGKRYPTYYMHLANKYIVEDLAKLYDIKENKSNQDVNYLKNIPKKYKIFFIYGYMDGDGCISFANRPNGKVDTFSVSILGNSKLIQGIKGYLEENKIYGNVYEEKKGKLVNPKYNFNIKNFSSLEIYLDLYVKLGFVLSRKRDRAIFILKEINERKNRIKKIREVNKDKSLNFCIICGKSIHHNATLCRECYVKENESEKKPSREILKEKIRALSFLKIGEEYGVSDNAIRKWCKSYNLPYQKSVIKSYTDTDWKKV